MWTCHRNGLLKPPNGTLWGSGVRHYAKGTRAVDNKKRRPPIGRRSDNRMRCRSLSTPSTDSGVRIQAGEQHPDQPTNARRVGEHSEEGSQRSARPSRSAAHLLKFVFATVTVIIPDNSVERSPMIWCNFPCGNGTWYRRRITGGDDAPNHDRAAVPLPAFNGEHGTREIASSRVMMKMSRLHSFAGDRNDLYHRCGVMSWGVGVFSPNDITVTASWSPTNTKAFRLTIPRCIFIS